ncbi:hypothetical protein [Flavobacterium hungaricum]|uniref:Uncharacterized protein n=1 Tax=Flavobacterium hungaricum TaxID=2082725 RepID=A0ABR9TPL7_9FLAO|nr:hypothetical protein [Flavobacterium hungaricum]MBE8727316.1 hypothetical protein [Flavobacterium hungaricum]
MGFNFSGIAINKSYKDNFEELQEELGWTLEKTEDIDFETASANWKDEGICDVSFSDTATLLFVSMDLCTRMHYLENANVFTFALSETSMAFYIGYTENGEEKREIMEVEGDRMTDDGEPLTAEENQDDTSEIIWNQIGVVLGEDFWERAHDEKAYRYVFK